MINGVAWRWTILAVRATCVNVGVLFRWILPGDIDDIVCVCTSFFPIVRRTCFNYMIIASRRSIFACRYILERDYFASNHIWDWLSCDLFVYLGLKTIAFAFLTLSDSFGLLLVDLVMRFVLFVTRKSYLLLRYIFVINSNVPCRNMEAIFCDQSRCIIHVIIYQFG